MTRSKTIVLVHGAWLNARSWDGVKARYEARGYTVIVPDWPLDDRDPADLRAVPHPGLHKIGQREIVAHYEAIIRALPEQPVRRQNIWHNSRRKLAECGPRPGVDIKRRSCGGASGDVRWSSV